MENSSKKEIKNIIKTFDNLIKFIKNNTAQQGDTLNKISIEFDEKKLEKIRKEIKEMK